MKKLNWTILAVVAIALIACKKDEPAENDVTCTSDISYSSDIATIISTSCATSGCHNASAAANGYVFETHNQVSDNATIILNVIRHESGFQAMPQGAPKWSDEQINNFACWIQQGKLNN